MFCCHLCFNFILANGCKYLTLIYSLRHKRQANFDQNEGTNLRLDLNVLAKAKENKIKPKILNSSKLFNPANSVCKKMSLGFSDSGQYYQSIPQNYQKFSEAQNSKCWVFIPITLLMLLWLWGIIIKKQPSQSVSLTRVNPAAKCIREVWSLTIPC